MAVRKVSLSIDEDVLAEDRVRAGHRELSSYVNEALRRQFQRGRLAELLAEMDAETGPVPDDVMEEARRLWGGPAAKRQLVRGWHGTPMRPSVHAHDELSKIERGSSRRPEGRPPPSSTAG